MGRNPSSGNPVLEAQNVFFLFVVGNANGLGFQIPFKADIDEEREEITEFVWRPRPTEINSDGPYKRSVISKGIAA